MQSKIKLFFVRWLIAVLVMPGLVYSQALPVSSMQRAIAGLIEGKMIKRGFAANDPRWGATLSAAGSGIAGAAVAAAAVTAAGVTAPAWVTAAATAALGAALAYGIDMAIDGVKWMMDQDGTTRYTKAGAAPNVGTGGLGGGSGYYCAGGNGSYCSSDPNSAAASFFDSIQKPMYDGYPFPYPSNCSPTSGSNAVCSMPGWYSDSTYYPRSSDHWNPPQNYTVGWYYGTPPGNCPAGHVWQAGTCQPTLVNPLPVPSVTLTKPASQAAADLTPEEKAKPANPDLVAKIADAAWKNAAASPGYNGAPYDAADPISAADASAFRTTNPEKWPTVGDLVAPQTAPAGAPAAQPWTLPNSAPSTSPGTDPGTGTGTNPSTPIEWGTFTPPVLEATPTMQSILDPLFNLWPQWSSFSFPQHEATCPTPSFKLPDGVMQGREIHFTQMCDFMEQNNIRVAMQAAFAVAWAILIAFIIMSA
jgi:hypothetical protein